MSLLGFAHEDEASLFDDDFHDARRGTPDHAGRVWKAYHARQALLEGERQHGRPVCVDPFLWGDLLGRKLAELIERERNNPRSFVRGGVTDRQGGRCMLPGGLGELFHRFCFRTIKQRPSGVQTSTEAGSLQGHNIYQVIYYEPTKTLRVSSFDGALCEEESNNRRVASKLVF